MSVVREQVAAQIQANNPSYIVKDFPDAAPDSFDGKRAVRVNVFRSELVKGSNNLTHNITVEVIVGKSDESFLDEALDEVLLSLQRIQGVSWTTASRTVFDEKFNGYQIQASANSSNIYRELILTEAQGA